MKILRTDNLSIQNTHTDLTNCQSMQISMSQAQWRKWCSDLKAMGTPVSRIRYVLIDLSIQNRYEILTIEDGFQLTEERQIEKINGRC